MLPVLLTISYPSCSRSYSTNIKILKEKRKEKKRKWNKSWHVIHS